MDDDIQPVPFDLVKDTLKSIRIWIDKITQLSVGIVSGQPIEPSDMIVLKMKMVKQLIIISSPLLSEDDLKEIETFFKEIKLMRGDIKKATGISRNVPIYTTKADYELDECIQGIEKGLKKYFIPESNKGERF